MNPLSFACILLMICLLAALPAAAAPPKADFYVAPNGKDDWSGRLAAPNRARTDGPFATLERAQQAVRSQRPTPNAQRPTPNAVMLRGGTYFLKAPLTFTPEDSNTVYAAYPGEKPVLSGGTRLTGWQSDGRGWTLHIPDVERDAWNFAQLWVNGARRFRPRLPKNGYYFIAGDLTPSPQAVGRGFDRIQFRPGDVRADWHNLSDIEILGFQTWTMARMRVASVEEEKHIVNFTGHTGSTQWYSALPRGNRYIVENVREALTEPGEWYLDRKTGDLTYLPMPGETPEKAEVIAPRLSELLRIQGDPANHNPVKFLLFEGLTFAHTNWNTPPEGNTAPQAEVNIGGAITAIGANHCAFNGCAVTHIGNYAIDLGEGCFACQVNSCEITDMGAGGVKIGEQGGREDEARLAQYNIVRQCLIAHGGRMHPAAVGVWIGASPHNTISHNEIADFYYTGISVGWSWGYAPTQSHHNTLEYNHIHDIGQGVLSDMGATYTLGLAPGTVQRYNLFHDVNSYSYGGWGIYFDEGTTGMVAENNVVYRCKSAGFHQHYGKDNIVRNNIFALNRESELMRTRAEEHLSFTFEHNIVYWKEGALLASNWSGDNYKLDYNLYWNAAGQPVTFAGMTLDQWRAKGQDVHSLISDPLFVAPEKGDFRLKPGSPVEKVGFKPFDISPAGRNLKAWLQSDLNPGETRDRESTREMTAWFRSVGPYRPVPRAFPPPPPPAPPAAIVQDFEEVPVGEKAPGATTSEENDRYTIRVTDETAASGKRSLKFMDGPGQQHNYNPHMFYDPGFDKGMIQESFDLRLEPGADMYHEWRDASSPYHVGPSLWIAPDGTLTSHGKRLMQLPHSRWIRFDIVCGLGPQAKGRYDLTVTLPGRVPPQRFKNLPCDPAFRELRWFGFTANGEKPAVFYLDNLVLKPRS
jgi:hypothetical protein